MKNKPVSSMQKEECTLADDKNRVQECLGILAARCASCKHDIFLLSISAILPEAISDGGLTPTTDTNLLLAT